MGAPQNSGEAAQFIEPTAKESASAVVVPSTSAGTSSEPVSGASASDTKSTSSSSQTTPFYVSQSATPDPRWASQGPYDGITGATKQDGPMYLFYYDPRTFCLMVGLYTWQEAGTPPPQPNTTYVPPPAAPAGKVAVFQPGVNYVGVWSVMDDNRGVTVYDKQTLQPKKWLNPGPISSFYTTQAPTTMFDRWDDATGTWVVDTEKKRASFVKKAFDLYKGTILPDEDILRRQNITPGPKYKAYVQSILDIIEGRDKITTVLPPYPTDPTQ